MSGIAVVGNSGKYGARSLLIPLLYPTLNISRSASLNSAIGRGLRRSKGVGFRGRERPQEGENGVREHGVHLRSGASGHDEDTLRSLGSSPSGPLWAGRHRELTGNEWRKRSLSRGR